MRINKEEIKIIKTVILKYIKGAKIYLFGSRIDDSKKGGDIDILVESKEKVSLKKQIKILSEFELNGISRKVDLVIKTSLTQKTNFLTTIDKEKIVI